MGGDGRGLRLLLALCTWVMLKANPLDFNGVDHYFQFILCSNDEWILAGSANLRVPSEIKSDKKKKKNVTREMEFTCFPECKVLSRCMGAVMEEGKKPIFFFFSRQRKQVAGNWKRRGHVRPQWTVWNSLKLSCCLSLDHLGFWEAEATLGSLGNSFHQRRRHWRGRDDLWSLNLLWQMFLLPFIHSYDQFYPVGQQFTWGLVLAFYMGLSRNNQRGSQAVLCPLGC